MSLLAPRAPVVSSWTDPSQVTFCGAGGLAVLLGVQQRARFPGLMLR
ncbi:hypothetical protein ABZW49_17715 [Nonomuraea wenchangensis]